jgi:hypothetical protein
MGFIEVWRANSENVKTEEKTEPKETKNEDIPIVEEAEGTSHESEEEEDIGDPPF